jgi:hypothetical protein
MILGCKSLSSLVDFIENDFDLEKIVRGIWKSFWKGQNCEVVKIE